MDRTADPCVDFYEYSCGGWKKINPIPSDQTSWSVYGKLYEDNLNYLRGILEQAATAKDRDAVTQKIGDYYAACMDEAEIEKLGAQPLQPDLTAIHNLGSTKDLATLIATLHLQGISALFGLSLIHIYVPRRIEKMRPRPMLLKILRTPFGEELNRETGSV